MIQDKHGRTIKKNGRKFRPLDGEDISDESRKAFIEDINQLSDPVNQRLHSKWFEVLTGESVKAEADRLGISLNLDITIDSGGLL